MKQLIYAVEDDSALRELYTYSLENEFICRCFDDGKSFFEAVEENAPSLVVLDVMLPGEDGFTILSRLKGNTKTSSVPVIMVSALGEEANKVRGLNLGANDYIAKPFSVLEFVARIRANLRKSGNSDNLSYKDIQVDSLKHQILINDKVIRTTLKEYNLLMYLCNNAEKVQSREILFDRVWGVSYIGETRTLDIHIKELRKKLHESNSIVEITTIRGVGYMLI